MPRGFAPADNMLQVARPSNFGMKAASLIFGLLLW
jgi:hypothetical protein